MTYPIFNSVANQIKSDLENRNVKIKTFKTWNEDRINATGLELVIELDDHTEFVKELSFNFDWDRFRETVLAQQLEGMEEHPFLLDDNMVSTSIAPVIDIEVTWMFDEERSQPSVSGENGNHRLDAASEWMERISEEVNKLLGDDDIITRWHIEVEGDEYGKYLSAINLISYFQYTLTDLKSLNSVHQFVTERLKELLLKSQKVTRISDRVLRTVAAA
ncbi:hypothetical protein NC796_04575 [Aliifodinibius sp. S!AR15-10]|uniref:hypothetical protein n=1 Tax=Aliifodinibius sp. S!AR15-10 TaxID=2950437 RepID=UPI002857ED21|nr:hypothetical protein [Aliifodinibius sp. S!AR15-10]MDR8390405.1 hypothetical protein [Aliifodinibius sp. S!AR15-10]